MPLVEASIIEGRDEERIRALIAALTDAVETTLEAPPESIRVIVREIPATRWGAGHETIAERRSR